MASHSAADNEEESRGIALLRMGAAAFFLSAGSRERIVGSAEPPVNGDIIQLNPLATREGFENDAVLTVQTEGFENDALLTASSSPR
jgi:hypothetical protein